MSDFLVINNEAARRFELIVEGEAAELTYLLQPESVTFLHTGVPEKLRGRGIAPKLAKAGLEFACEKELTVVPLCPFVAAYIKQHPEYLYIVREDHRARIVG
jgi:predicted GNAT family acetyltransferase